MYSGDSPEWVSISALILPLWQDPFSIPSLQKSDFKTSATWSAQQ